MDLTAQDKVRKILDLVNCFGDTIDNGYGSGQTIHDLQGVAQVRMRQQGPRTDFTIVARGIEVEGSKWVASIERTEIIRGEERDFDRVYRNAGKKERQIHAAQKAKRREEAETRAHYKPTRLHF